MTAGHLGIVVSFSPLCVCFGPATSRAAWGPSRLGHARRGRGKPGGKKKKDLLEGPAAVHSRARSGDSSRVSWA